MPASCALIAVSSVTTRDAFAGWVFLGSFAKPRFQRLLIVIGLIPSSGRIGGGKFDDKDPFRHWIAFQKIDLAATSDDAPTKARNRRQRARQMSLIGSKIAYVDIADDVCRDGSLLANSFRSSQWMHRQRR